MKKKNEKFNSMPLPRLSGGEGTQLLQNKTYWLDETLVYHFYTKIKDFEPNLSAKLKILDQIRQKNQRF